MTSKCFKIFDELNLTIVSCVGNLQVSQPSTLCANVVVASGNKHSVAQPADAILERIMTGTYDACRRGVLAIPGFPDFQPLTDTLKECSLAPCCWKNRWWTSLRRCLVMRRLWRTTMNASILKTLCSMTGPTVKWQTKQPALLQSHARSWKALLPQRNLWLLCQKRAVLSDLIVVLEHTTKYLIINDFLMTSYLFVKLLRDIFFPSKIELFASKLATRAADRHDLLAS